ncbi:MAG: hypothetical protein AAF699_06835 [Pseudomonadota bacterium]
MKQNPNPHGSPREQRALLKKRNKLSRERSELQGRATMECLSEQKERGESGPVTTDKIARSRLNGIYPYTYNYNCINGGSHADELAQLDEEIQAVQELIDSFQGHNTRINKTVERLLPEIVARHAGEQFLVVINKDSKVWYSNDGLSVDITGAILNKLRDQNPKIQVGKRRD